MSPQAFESGEQSMRRIDPGSVRPRTQPINLSKPIADHGSNWRKLGSPTLALFGLVEHGPASATRLRPAGSPTWSIPTRLTRSLNKIARLVVRPIHLTP